MSNTTRRTDAHAIVDAWASAYNDQNFDRFGTLYADDIPYTCGAFGLAFAGRDAFVAHVKEYAGAVPDRTRRSTGSTTGTRWRRARPPTGRRTS
ncbi:nuclear transport factor 2 family protein [Streptomyces cinnamoneus]|uniref:nuclear transport factor 2 family protein n=1 Tax=Streptomyces cinnamoneus TaxID=53446 RepID=UPI0033C58CF8